VEGEGRVRKSPVKTKCAKFQGCGSLGTTYSSTSLCQLLLFTYLFVYFCSEEDSWCL
jgi:hypothetical protein